MTENERKMKIYIDYLMDGDAIILNRPSVPKVVSTRTCLHCGNSYQISIPYEECQPGNRDLCDCCIAKGIQLP